MAAVIVTTDLNLKPEDQMECEVCDEQNATKLMAGDLNWFSHGGCQRLIVCDECCDRVRIGWIEENNGLAGVEEPKD